MLVLFVGFASLELATGFAQIVSPSLRFRAAMTVIVPDSPKWQGVHPAGLAWPIAPAESGLCRSRHVTVGRIWRTSLKGAPAHCTSVHRPMRHRSSPERWHKLVASRPHRSRKTARCQSPSVKPSAQSFDVVFSCPVGRRSAMIWAPPCSPESFNQNKTPATQRRADKSFEREGSGACVADGLRPIERELNSDARRASRRFGFTMAAGSSGAALSHRRYHRRMARCLIYTGRSRSSPAAMAASASASHAVWR